MLPLSISELGERGYGLGATVRKPLVFLIRALNTLTARLSLIYSAGSFSWYLTLSVVTDLF